MVLALAFPAAVQAQDAARPDFQAKIVAPGKLELASIGPPDTWRASKTIRLAVVRIDDGDVVAATDFLVTTNFEERESTDELTCSKVS